MFGYPVQFRGMRRTHGLFDAVIAAPIAHVFINIFPSVFTPKINQIFSLLTFSLPGKMYIAFKNLRFSPYLIDYQVL